MIVCDFLTLYSEKNKTRNPFHEGLCIGKEKDEHVFPQQGFCVDDIAVDSP